MNPDGKVTFNAFGTISFNPATKVYILHSHAMGNVGDFVLALTSDGYTWDGLAWVFRISEGSLWETDPA